MLSRLIVDTFFHYKSNSHIVFYINNVRFWISKYPSIYGDWCEGNRVTLRFGFLIAHSTQSPTLFTDEPSWTIFPYISYWHVIFYFHFQELLSLSEIPCLSLGDDFSTKYVWSVEHLLLRWFFDKTIFEPIYSLKCAWYLIWVQINSNGTESKALMCNKQDWELFNSPRQRPKDLRIRNPEKP